jgi:hypothetical protein
MAVAGPMDPRHVRIRDMARFIDRIVDEWGRQGDGSLEEKLRVATKFRLQNIADHALQSGTRRPQELGFVIPTWHSFYAEWRWQPEPRADLRAGLNVAALIETFDKDEIVEGHRIRWSILEHYFLDFRDHIDMVLVASMLNAKGTFVPLSWDEAGAALLPDVPRRAVGGQQLFCRMLYPHCQSHDSLGLFEVSALGQSVIYSAIALHRDGRAETAPAPLISGVAKRKGKRRVRYPDDNWQLLTIDRLN